MDSESLNIRSSNNFDLIRLIAASTVIVTHSYALTGKGHSDPLGDITSGALSFSHLAVAIFFTVSGYLITQSAFTTKTWKGYMWRRFLRIWPGLITVLFLTSFVLGPIVTSKKLIEYFTDSLTFNHLLSSLLYIKSYDLPGVFETNPVRGVNGSLWTLSYEFTLYIVVILSFKAGMLKDRKTLLTIWIFMFIFRIFLGHKYFWYNYSIVYLLNQNMMYLYEWSFYFLSGMIFFMYVEKLKPQTWIFLVLIMAYIIFAWKQSSDTLRILNYVVVLYSLFYFSFKKSAFPKLSEWGDFSYGMYIYAFPIQQSIVHFTNNNISIFQLTTLTFFCTLPFAVLSWLLIEKKALSFKKLIS
jgi:peptidoglycan/LPS O-acetylase OafA/YrhL